MPAPRDTLDHALRLDPAAPRVTCYDDALTPPERIELSARVLDNWVAKAANLLVEEFDAGPGTVVRLALPAHWRAVYWAYAAWSVGATVRLDDGPADLVVSDDLDDLGDLVDLEGVDGLDGAVLVTLPALARSATVQVPPGVIDEARELATYPDRFVPAGASTPYATAFADAAYGLPEGRPDPGWPDGARVHLATHQAGDLLAAVLDAFAVGGSVVLSRGTDPAALPARLSAEQVTVDLVPESRR